MANIYRRSNVRDERAAGCVAGLILLFAFIFTLLFYVGLVGGVLYVALWILQHFGVL